MLTNLLLILLIIIGLINIFILLKKKNDKQDLDELAYTIKETIEEAGDDITDRLSSRLTDIKQDINSRSMHELSENREHRKEMQEILTTSLKELQNTNSQKLSDIQSEINQKLDQSLNERLDKSFKTIGEQLNSLYKSLGELSKLEDGVMNLNRTLSNVKTRGVFGEGQLENILADILSPNLYDKNVITKKGSRDSVEFAVKIPDKENPNAFIYLPVDSKFPTTIYDKIQDAADNSDSEALSHAVKELEQRIKTEAKTIQSKYIEPPYTTDFAILFLPTESLYAEILRIPGLANECQQKYHIIITGPTTVAALLNSLSIGFRYMAVNRDSQTILKLLQAIKAQYQTLSKLISTADSRIDMAKKATKELQHRADIINSKLTSVEELDSLEAEALLGIKISE
ncbi:MAG: DNA recombination protein RmuC [Eubacteriales bacterium]|nr:DNA recombination protein RmuC [Eubacteriales bacterium]